MISLAAGMLLGSVVCSEAQGGTIAASGEGQVGGVFRPIQNWDLSGLELVPAEALPKRGGSFHILSRPNWPPLPLIPPWAVGLDVYALPNRPGVFLVDDSPLFSDSLSQQTLARSSVAPDLLTSVLAPSLDSQSAVATPQYGPEDLWLGLSTPTNGMATLAVNTPEPDSVFDLFYTPSLTASSGWFWLARGLAGQTNFPIHVSATNMGFFVVGTTNGLDPDGLTAAYRHFVGGVGTLTNDFDSDGMPDAWEIANFGDLSQTAAGNFDGAGGNNLQDYLSGADPNQINLGWLTVTNFYCNTNLVPVRLDLLSGSPAYVAVFVDSTNYDTVVWEGYHTYVTVDLGTNQGWHTVRIGARGRAPTSLMTWKNIALKLDTIPPQLIITNPPPAELVGGRAIIQVQGWAAEPVGNLTFAVSNATGGVSDGPGSVSHQLYDTNLHENAQCTFQYYDVHLSPGQNVVTLRATDLAGNATTTNLTLTLDYSTDTNGPLIKVVWPKDGTQIGGALFTLRGTLDDDNASLNASIIDQSGNTNQVAGMVERGGQFWAEGLPLGNGTNFVVLTATDTAGNLSTTNLTVVKAGVTLAFNDVGLLSVNQARADLGGTVSDPTYSVWVNGTQATVYPGGNWSAPSVRIYGRGTATFDAVAYPPGGGPSVAAQGWAQNAASQASDGASCVAQSMEAERYTDTIEDGYGATETITCTSQTRGASEVSSSTRTMERHATEHEDLDGQYYLTWSRRLTEDSSYSGNCPPDFSKSWSYHIEYNWSDDDLVGTYNWHRVEDGQSDDGVGTDPYWVSGGGPLTDHDLIFDVNHGQAHSVDYEWDNPTEDGSWKLRTEVEAHTQQSCLVGGRAGLDDQRLLWFYVLVLDAGQSARDGVIWNASPWVRTPVRCPPGAVGGEFADQNLSLFVSATPGARIDATVKSAGQDYYSPDGFTTEVTPVIWLGGADITRTNTTVVVGQKISLTCDQGWLEPDSFPVSQYQWEIPGLAISNFIVGTNFGMACTNIPLTTNTVEFYWLTGGPKEVKCTVTIGGKKVTTRAKFNVLRPNAKLTASIQGKVEVWHNALRFQNSAFPGITFMGRDEDTVGNWVCFQMGSESARYQDSVTGKWARAQGNGLDGNYPIGDWDDSPNIPLPADDAGFSTVEGKGDFTTYLAFAPPGSSIYVPIRQIHWNWGGTAVLTATNGWVLASPTNHVDASDAQAPATIQWTDRVQRTLNTIVNEP